MSGGPNVQSLQRTIHELELEVAQLRTFKTISDNATVGNAIIDRREHYLYVNEAFAQMHGYTIEELTGTHFSCVHTPEQLEALSLWNKKLKEKGILHNVEVWRVKKDGTEFPSLTNATIFNAATDTEGFTSIMTIDISARKQTEDELARKNKELEEANIALRVVIETVRKERTELEKTVINNLRSMMRPYLLKLKKTSLTKEQDTWVKAVESTLKTSIKPTSNSLSAKYPGLSPSELQVAHFVKEGKKTPEIAQTLNISQRTVDVHRRNIRIKLGLKNKKVNLQTFLLSIA